MFIFISGRRCKVAPSSISALIGLNRITLSRFEKNRKEIQIKMDALVRLFCAQVLCERSNKNLPKPIISVLEELESESTLDLRDLRLEHVDLGEDGLAAEPRHGWRQTA